ncbi:MAG: SDR family oxidoreductase [Candidatus Thermoplasmatota archaeon]|nr:SDR family oxidoreductase [Candidatus Thermoplasmatota archaeon]
MAEKKSLEGKVALITGASSGIGKAVSKRLAGEGAKVCLAARRKEKLEDLAEKLSIEDSVETLVLPTDITEEKEVKQMVSKAVDKFNKLDMVVNNAGVIRYGDIEDLSTESYKLMMETNCDGMFYSTREALPHLRKSEGNLVYIGSFDAGHPRSFNPIYAASKWWTKGFAHSIESIVGEDGVAVTLINPSEVRTSIEGEEGESYREKFDEGEAIEPEEVAEAVFFAVDREKQTTASEINLFRRDKLSDFF